MSLKTSYRVFSLVQVALAVSVIVSCSDEDGKILSPDRVVEKDTVMAGTQGDGWIGPYWPELINGDCEFGENGPVVTLDAEVYVKGSDSLMCRVCMRADETERDWSAAEDSWDELLYIAPEGWRISDIGISPASCHVQYIDNDYDEDENRCERFAFRSKGHTSGDDIICGRVADENMTYVHVWIDSLYIERELE